MMGKWRTGKVACITGTVVDGLLSYIRCNNSCGRELDRPSLPYVTQFSELSGFFRRLRFFVAVNRVLALESTSATFKLYNFKLQHYDIFDLCDLHVTLTISSL